jgi:hypothetical protein
MDVGLQLFLMLANSGPGCFTSGKCLRIHSVGLRASLDAVEMRKVVKKGTLLVPVVRRYID